MTLTAGWSGCSWIAAWQPVLGPCGLPRRPMMDRSGARAVAGWALARLCGSAFPGSAGSHPKRVKGVCSIGGGPHLGSGLTIDSAAYR